MNCAFLQVSQFSLATVFDDGSFASRLAIATGLPHGGETWYTDAHGSLYLCVDKNTYERLSLVGVPVNRKKRDKFIVRVDLRDSTRKEFHQAKDACWQWDAERRELGMVGWEALMPVEQDVHVPPGSTNKLHHATSYIRHHKDVVVPRITLGPRPTSNDGAVAWDERMNEFFEWFGMVCIGSPRTLARDRVDSYVSGYIPPDGSLGAVVHMRWCGLFSGSFIRDVIAMLGDPAFAFVMVHGWDATPFPVLGGSSVIVQTGGVCVSRSLSAPLR